MGVVKTVKIQRLTGFAVINESDYDPSKHKLYVEPQEKVEKPEKPEEKEEEPEVDPNPQLTAFKDAAKVIEENKSASNDEKKEALEVMCREEFNIELDKRKSLKNMIAQAEELLTPDE